MLATIHRTVPSNSASPLWPGLVEVTRWLPVVAALLLIAVAGANGTGSASADDSPSATTSPASPQETGHAPDEGHLAEALRTLRSVGPKGRHHTQAQVAWRRVATAPISQLPEVLAGFDGAGPLAANWLRTAAEAIFERGAESGQQLPTAELADFLRDREQPPRGRELAYRWLKRTDPPVAESLLPTMLDDPSAALRREAVARKIDHSEQMLEAGQKDEAVAAFESALDAARDEDQVRSIAKQLQQLGRRVDLARKFGFLTTWPVIGPFDNTDESGFDRIYPPEREIDLDATYVGKDGDVAWQPHTTDHPLGRVDFNKIFGEQKGVIAYGLARFVSEQPREVELRYSSFNAVKVWVNGALIGSHEIYHSGSQFDQYVSRASLNQGENLILVKVCQNEQTQSWAKVWHIQLRVCDRIGGAILSADRPGDAAAEDSQSAKAEADSDHGA